MLDVRVIPSGEIYIQSASYLIRNYRSRATILLYFSVLGTGGWKTKKNLKRRFEINCRLVVINQTDCYRIEIDANLV